MWFGRSKADRFRDAKVSMWFHLLDVSRSGYLAREDFQSLADRVLGVIRGAGHSGDGGGRVRGALGRHPVAGRRGRRWDHRADDPWIPSNLAAVRQVDVTRLRCRAGLGAVFGVGSRPSGGISHEEYALYLRSIGSHADAPRLRASRSERRRGGFAEEVVQHYTDWVCTSDYESPGNLLMTGSVPASTG